MKLSSITAFFPCYGDSGTIATMVLRALQTLPLVTDDYEVVVIDDGSPDDANLILDELVRVYPQYVRVIHNSCPSGYGGVLRCGFQKARKDWIFYTDGDAQYNPRELVSLVDKVRDDIDMVNGYKIKRRDPFFRVVVGLMYQYFIKFVFGLVIRDVDCDFRLMRRSIFETVHLEAVSGAITVELVKKIQDAGFRIVEAPVSHYYRQYGLSQFFNFKRVAQTVLKLFMWWWRLVIRKEHLRDRRVA